MIQEFIPGKEKVHFYLLIDKIGQLKVSLCTRDLRNLLRIVVNFPTAMESLASYPWAMDVARFVHKLGWWGGTTVELKIDPRDSIPKFMEMNPRIGAHLWYRTEMGINEPLMCLRIAREEEVKAVKDYPVGTILLDPMEDTLGLAFLILDFLVYKFRTGLQEKTAIDPLNPPMALRELIQSYKQTYFNGKPKVFNPYFRYFFQDPLVSILWWVQFSTIVLRAIKQLGR